MGAATFFWNRIAKRYSRSPIADQTAYEEKLEITRQHFTPQSRVLEIGCGTGSTALIHGEKVHHVDAWDTSANMVAIARQKAADAGVTNVEFHAGTIFDCDADQGSYDVVLALNVLHLISDKGSAMQRTIDRAHELLAPGGVFIASTACLSSMNPIGRGLLAVPGFIGLLPKLNVLDRKELLSRLTKPGFEVVTNITPGSPSSVFTVARKSL